MYESEVSTSSYGKDDESIVAPPNKQSAGVQGIHLQNEQLKDMNEQLKSQVESLRNQLKDALAAVQASQTVGDQIKTMKAQLTDATQKRDKLAKEMKELNAQYITESHDLNEKIKELQTQLADEQQKTQASEQKILKIRKEKALLKTALEDRLQFIDIADQELQKTECTKKKLKQKTVTALEQLQIADSKVEELQLALQKSESERETLSQTVDSLTVQLNSANAFHEETKRALEQAKKETENKIAVIQSLEMQLSAQTDEIGQFTEERPRLISLIEKSHKALFRAEALIQKLTEEKNDLANRVKVSQTTKISNIISQGSINDLKWPFDQEISQKCDELMKLPQYQPIQRVQLVLNELAHRIANLKSTYESHIHAMGGDLEKARAAVEKDNNYGQILASLLKELKERAPQTGDQAFIDFVNKQCDQIDPQSLPKGKLNSFYSMSSDDRRRALKESRMASKEQLIMGQTKVFDDIKTRTKQAQENLEKQQALAQQQQLQQLQQLQESAPGTPSSQKSNVSENRDQVIADLNAKIDKLKQSRKQIHQALKEAQENVSAMMITEKEARTQVSQLQTQVETLSHENEVLRVQLQVAENENLLRQKDQNLSSSSISSADSLACTELKQKIEENEKLTEMVRTLQQTMETSLAKANKRSKQREEALKAEIDTLKSDLLAKEQECEQKTKKVKKQIKAQKDAYKQTIEELQNKHSEAKKNFDETIQNLKTKAEESRKLSNQLVDSLNASEERNQKLQEDQANQVKAAKDLQSQIVILKQQLSKEKQNLRTQLSVQTLQAEAQKQELVNQARAKFEKRVNDLLEVAAKTIGSFYGIDESQFSEDSFAQLAEHVKSDLEKLRYFQNETTKYIPTD